MMAEIQKNGFFISKSSFWDAGMGLIHFRRKYPWEISIGKVKIPEMTISTNKSRKAVEIPKAIGCSSFPTVSEQATIKLFITCSRIEQKRAAFYSCKT